jgi:hypothetical protein
VRKPVSAKSGSENLLLSGGAGPSTNAALSPANSVGIEEFNKEIQAMRLVKDREYVIKLVEASSAPATFVVPKSLLPASPLAPETDQKGPGLVLQSDSTTSSVMSSLISSISSKFSYGILASPELERSVSL